MPNPVSGAAIGAVIDYLVDALTNGITTQSGTVIPPLTDVDKFVAVGDGLPDQRTQSWFVIGRSGFDDGSAASATEAHTTLGALRIDELWDLDWFAACYREGPAQKPARDAVIALYDAFVRLLQADLTLGGLTHTGGYVEITRLELDQTLDDSEGGAAGNYRKAQISGQLTIKNNYYPS